MHNQEFAEKHLRRFFPLSEKAAGELGLTTTSIIMNPNPNVTAFISDGLIIIPVPFVGRKTREEGGRFERK